MDQQYKLELFLLMLVLGSASPAPSKCVLTIISCCNPDQPNGRHPFRCFEVNECAGLYWEGKNACSGRTVARAIAALNDDMELETRMTRISNNRVELEQFPRKMRSKETPSSGRTRSWGRTQGKLLTSGGVLRSNERVQPVFHKDSNMMYLQISPLGGGVRI